MKQYIERLQNERTPHERRQVALRVASVVTALFFVAWIATLGVRVAEQNASVAQQNANNSAAAGLTAVQNTDSVTSN